MVEADMSDLPPVGMSLLLVQLCETEYRVLKPCTSVLEHAAMMMIMAKAE